MTARARRRRRWPILVAVLMLIAALAVGTMLVLRSPAGPEPDIEWNVLLVTFDTTRADHLSCYGAEYAETPTIDRMARHGVRFESCYAPAPMTLPSHTSILTGLYPFRHGLRDNGVGALDERSVTLAEVLGDNGYATGAVVGAAVLEARYGLDQGFDSYEDDFGGVGAPSTLSYVERNAGAVTDRALEWIETVADSQFFLWVHYFDPHAPYAAPGYGPGSSGHPYDLEIAYADSQLDRLLTRVGVIQHATGRYTLIVFAADHGESLWNRGEPTHGLFVYNDTIRVPLIVADPTMTERGEVIREPVSLVDIYPTILSRLGIPAPSGIDGRALRLSPPESGGANERPIYFENRAPFYSYGWSPLEGVVLGTHKYIHAPRAELYDLAADPFEEANLFQGGQPKAVELRDALDALKQRPGPELTRAALQLEEESRRRLRALGYLSGVLPEIEPAGDLADPKDRIEVHRSILAALEAVEQDDGPQAVTVLKDVLDDEPVNPRALHVLLYLLEDGRVTDEAVQLLNQAGSQTLRPPLDGLVPFNLGIAFGNEGRFAEAEEQLRRAAAVAPDDPDAYFSLARAVEEQQGPAEEVITLLQRVIELDPGHLEAVRSLAFTLQREGHFDRAGSAYDRVLELDPQNLVALNNSAWCRYQLGRDLETALERTEAALAIEATDPRVRHTHACILLALDRAPEAITQLEDAVTADPGYAIAYYHLGVARETTGDSRGAFTALQRAIDLAGPSAPEWLADARARLEGLGDGAR